LNKQSSSPDNKININSTKQVTSPTTTSSTTKVSTSSTGKGLNIIPLKGSNLSKEQANTNTHFYSTNEKVSNDRLSPKPRDLKITQSNLSPKQKQIPLSTKNANETKTGFDAKYSNKVYANITNNLMHKSPSPKHFDPKAKKSPETKK
jgi:hypothetical protein